MSSLIGIGLIIAYFKISSLVVAETRASLFTGRHQNCKHISCHLYSSQNYPNFSNVEYVVEVYN